MTAQIAGFLSRADIGLRAPKSVTRRIDADAGMTLHYGGDGRAPATHAECVKTWRDWQVFHMTDPARGWADIAYSFGFCNHGYAFAGRGLGVRTAANGTNEGNQGSHAACWIGGSQSTPSALALDAADWLIHENRTQGGNRRVWGHRRWKPTGCPGSPVLGHALARDEKDVPLPTQEDDDMPHSLEEIARAVWDYGAVKRMVDGKVVVMPAKQELADAASAPHRVWWESTVDRMVDGQVVKVPAIQELADVRGDAMALRAEVAGLRHAVQALAAGQSGAEVIAGVQDVVRAALTEAVRVDVTVAGQPRQ